MVYSTLKQSLAFHSSPEAFLSERLETLSVSNDDVEFDSAVENGAIVQASILNRNVHIVSSYLLCKDILEFRTVPDGDSVLTTTTTKDDDDDDGVSTDEVSKRNLAKCHTIKVLARTEGTEENDGSARLDVFATAPAYRELMADFFPPPNILLEDSRVHAVHKELWKKQLSTLPIDSEETIRGIIKRFILSTLSPGSTFDLYDSLKQLSWDLLFGVFLNLNPEESQSDRSTFTTLQQAQEALLQGQFSLFPVSIRMPFLWRSARSKGIAARKQLQQDLMEHIESKQQEAEQSVLQSASSCPLLRRTDVTDPKDISSHCLLFTSSIANKALASLLTALVMNVFLMPVPGNDGKRLVDLLRSHTRQERRILLRSILLETERLSPPVVGVMRRVQQDIMLGVSEPKDDIGENDHYVPKGHDVWMYFVGAGRDPHVFVEPDEFRFDRFMRGEDENENLPGFAFGAGSKTCLGRDIVRTMAISLVEEMIDAGAGMTADKVSRPGVRAWLGWEKAEDPQAFAKDLKQLPCQRPREPIVVTVGLRV